MATSLRLDLLSYDISQYTCWCSVPAHLQDIADALPLHVVPPEDGQQPTRAIAASSYHIEGVSYICQAMLHTMEDDGDYCCLSFKFQFDDDPKSAPAKPWHASLKQLSDGLDSLSGSYTAKDRRAEAYGSWDGSAPSLHSLKPPDAWPADMTIAGVKFVAPGGDAHSIIQEFDGDDGLVTTANTWVYGGDILTSAHIRGGLRCISGLAVAFRDGDWGAITRRIHEYQNS